jgi:hypothetical protein
MDMVPKDTLHFIDAFYVKSRYYTFAVYNAAGHIVSQPHKTMIIWSGVLGLFF